MYITTVPNKQAQLYIFNLNEYVIKSNIGSGYIENNTRYVKL